MRDFALISCVGSKRSEPCAAGQIYTSTWFQKAREYVSERYSAWAILSAKHGIVHPWKTIEPYDKTLNTMPKSERIAWASRVTGELAKMYWDRIDLFAGARYREFIEPWMKDNGINYNVPLRGLGIGQQLRWFNENH